MELSRNFTKIRDKLFADSAARECFAEAVFGGKSQRPAVIWNRPRPEVFPFRVLPPEPFQPEFVDALVPGERAGAHPLHDEGAYYCLDFSSVFEAAVVSAVTPRPRVILDMCASPGGKTVFLSRAFAPELLVSNETIRKRTAQLLANIRRCGVESTVVSLDPAKVVERARGSFDLVLVDAPCSGQSLIARGQKAPGCFHPATINLCSNRQKRVLANSAQLVAGGGHLAYMTCTYSPEENERVVEWLLNKFPQFAPCEVPQLAAHRSELSQEPCYRLFPQAGLGAGGFTVLLRNTEDALDRRASAEKTRAAILATDRLFENRS